MTDLCCGIVEGFDIPSLWPVYELGGSQLSVSMQWDPGQSLVEAVR